ncbi:MAG TPA: HAD family hydrolase [Patescibacteria group bacterium]|nr:MAG: hypothetical protein A2752_03245 [Candidatus Uhrbacteria bacterium RIFCSPHIGHO2_01_FULL_46_23]HLB60196.1 HAD family hydrolase [Patescibacteria group bacterium]
MIESIVFDLDGTLYQSIPEVDEELYLYWVSAIEKKLGLTREEAEQRFIEGKKIYKSSTEVLRQMGFGTAYQIIRQAEVAYMPALSKNLQQDKRLEEMLTRLRKEYNLAIITNSSIENVHGKLGLLGLSAGLFSAIVGIDEDGITKPHPRLFAALLNDLGKEASSILIIGDRPEVDLFPAKKLGMRTVLVTWGKAFPDDPSVDYQVETVYDVEGLVNKF